MILLEVGSLMPMILTIYFIAHIPAFVLLILGLIYLKSKPQTGKTLLIFSGVYFIIGGGICASMI